MCSASHTYQTKYTITTHACLVFALPAAIMETCPTFIKIGLNPVGPIFGINPQNVLSPKMLEESSCLKENPLLLMTLTFTVWCSLRLREEVGNIKTTNNLQSIAETFHQSPKKKNMLVCLHLCLTLQISIQVYVGLQRKNGLNSLL
jgi:hypothetical protein